MRFINLCCFPRGAHRRVSHFTDQHLVLPGQSVVEQGESAQHCLLSSGNQLPELSLPWDREGKESFPRNPSLLLRSSQSKRQYCLCFLSAGVEVAIVTAGSRPLQPAEEMFRRQEGHFGVLEPGGCRGAGWGGCLECTTPGWQQVRCEEPPRAVETQRARRF